MRVTRWYPSWGADDRLYTPWTDGSVTDMVTHQLVGNSIFGGWTHATTLTHRLTFPQVASSSGGSGPWLNSTTGFAIVEGDDPGNLTVTHVNVFASSTAPYLVTGGSPFLTHRGQAISDSPGNFVSQPPLRVAIPRPRCTTTKCGTTEPTSSTMVGIVATGASHVSTFSFTL